MKQRSPAVRAFVGLYAAVSCALLLWQVARMLELPVVNQAEGVFTVVHLALFLPALFIGQLWRRREVRLCLYGLIWIALTLLWKLWQQWGLDFVSMLRYSPQVLYSYWPTLSAYTYALGFCVCLPLMAEDRAAARRWVLLHLAVWTVWMCLLSLVGLWAALTGTLIHSSGEQYIGIALSDRRLNLLGYCTHTGALLGASVLAAVLCAAMARGRAVRIACLLAAVPMLLCLSLTDSRGSYLALGGSAGLAAALALARSRHEKPSRRLLLWAGCAIAGVAAVWGLMMLCRAGLNRLAAAPQTHEMHWMELLGLSSASAEEAAAHRSLLQGDMLSGRGEIWRAVFRLFGAEPWTLLHGTSVTDLSETVNRYTQGTGLVYAHTHNLFLQTLMELGLPGLCLMCLFLVRWGKSALSLMRPERPLWLRLLPLLPLYLLVGDMADCHTPPVYKLPFVPLLYLSLSLCLRSAELAGSEPRQPDSAP